MGWQTLNRSQKWFLLVVVVCASYAAGNAIYLAQASPSVDIAKGYHVIYIVPHEHFDPYWLDPWHTEVERWCTNFRDTLDIMRVNPQMCYVVDQVVAIKYFWENYPDYHDIIKSMIAAGRLEVVQGFVSQPDENLVSEEGLIEDAVLGMKWAETVLGANITTGWELDPFGFGVGTPTYYKNLGLNFMVFERAPDGMQNGVFLWTGTDNSSIYGYKVADYNMNYGSYGMLTGANIQGSDDFFKDMLNLINPASQDFQHTVNPANLSDDRGDVLVLYGADFSEPNLELAQYVDAWNAQEAARTGYVCEIGTPHEFFSKLQPLLQQGGIITNSVSNQEDLNPVFGGGFYTSRVLFKYDLNYFEEHLVTYETFAAIAKQLLPSFAYPEDYFSRIWYKDAVSHHHDSITGTSSQLVYEDNMQLFDQEWDPLQSLGGSIFGAISNQINILYGNDTTYPVIVFNPLSWNRTDVLAYNLTLPEDGIQDVEVIDPDANVRIPSQVIPIVNATPTTLRTFTLLFTPTVPSMGYKTYLVHPLTTVQPIAPHFLNGTFTATSFSIENQYYRIDFNQTGSERLDIFDKTMNWSVFSQNVSTWELLAYNDPGNAYSFNLKSLQENITASIPQVEVVETGPVRFHITFSYQVGASSYNRSLFLYDGLPRVDFQEDMNFLPTNNTALAFRFGFNVTNPDYVYDAPFGSVDHDANATIYPALYYVNVQNATLGASVITYAIHGFRRVSDQLEGFLVQYLQDPSDVLGTSPSDVFDNGTFSFAYILTTYNQTDPVSVLRQQRLAYEWNFHLQACETSRHAGSLNDVLSAYQVDAPNVMILGLRKDLWANDWSCQLVNFNGTPTIANVTTDAPFSQIQEANFQNQPSSTTPLTDANEFSVNLGGFAWNTILLANTSQDVNGPQVSEVTFPDAWNTGSLTAAVTVTDREGSPIASVILQYCFTETFENQTWTSIPMTEVSPGHYSASVPWDVINGRPVYFRAEALDAFNNLGTSPAATVAQMSAFTPWELVVAILLTALVLIMVGYGLTRLVKRRSVKNPPVDARNSQGSRLECSTCFASAHAREILLLLFPTITLGTWVAAWGVVKGFFGAFTITNLLPAASGYPNWSLTLHNNIFDFFGPDFFIGTLIVAFAMFALIPAITNKRYRAKHLALVSLGMTLVPLMGVLLFPILFLISGAPVTYYGQILSFAGVIYSLVPTGIYAGTYQILIWFAIPVIIAGVGAPCAVEGEYWIWKKVIPRSWQEYGASFTTRIRGIFCRNAQTAATNTHDKDEIGSEANADE